MLVPVFVCLSATAFAYSTDLIDIFQESQQELVSHRVWSRQTNTQETRASSSWQRQSRSCEGPNRQRGRCVGVEECVLPQIYQDYVKNRAYFCVRNSGSVGVCCPDSVSSPVRYQEGIFTARPQQSAQQQQQSVRPQQQQTTTALPNRVGTSGQGSDPADQSYPLGEYRVCGRNGKKISRITSGAPTTVKDWPWMAALIYRSSLKQFCGGTVITKRHVLTAAHCFPRNDPNEFLVLLGDYDLKKSDDSKSKLFTVSQLAVHEDFDVTSYENDIAIVTINATTIYNSFIQPCCLPSPGPRFTNRTSIVTGWGKMEFGGPSPSILREVPVPIWDQPKCTPNFAQTIFNTTLCAGAYEGGKDACQGDSGGPLVIQRQDERWAIVGIVSWGIRCGEKNKPGVYTRVNDYLDWISQTIL